MRRECVCVRVRTTFSGAAVVESRCVRYKRMVRVGGEGVGVIALALV